MTSVIHPDQQAAAGAPASPRPIRVALVEDDAVQRAGIVELLAGAPEIQLAGAWGSAAAALEALPALRPDVGLVDIGLPETSGVELVRLLKPALPGTQFLMLTVVEDVPRVFAALAAGATGYLLKKDAPARLASAIGELHEGGSPMSGSIARQVVLVFQREPAQASPEAASLTDRERQILDLLAAGRLYKEIGDALDIRLGTVRTYVRRIYEKLHARNRGEAVALARRASIERL